MGVPVAAITANMASSPPRAPSVSSASSGSSDGKRQVDPITRTALRYTISPREYELLHQYLISRAPQRVQRRTPKPVRYEKITKSTSESGDYNVAAVRAAFRVFAVSFALMLLFHRLLSRFFKRLRASLLEQNADPFRKRNPRVSRILTGQYTPAIGASLAGLCLGVAPSDQLRMTLAIYVLTRSLEFGYNALEEGGMLWKAEKDGGKGKPWWVGSWMIMPFACGQLLHA